MNGPTRCIRTLTLAVAIAAGGWSAHAQEPSLATVLERAGDYVAGFQRQLSGVVAEETYIQDVREPMPLGDHSPSADAHRPDAPRAQVGPAPRQAVSGRTAGFSFATSSKWTASRSAIAASASMKLFVEPTLIDGEPGRPDRQRERRYNIGNVMRNINVPVFALLDPRSEAQPVSEFARAGNGAPSIARRPEARRRHLGDSLRGNRARDDDHDDVRARSAVAGALLDRSGDRPRADVGAGRRRHTGRRNGRRRSISPTCSPTCSCPWRCASDTSSGATTRAIDGAATYGKFRQFQVKVDEKIAPIKDRGMRSCSMARGAFRYSRAWPECSLLSRPVRSLRRSTRCSRAPAAT